MSGPISSDRDGAAAPRGRKATGVTVAVPSRGDATLGRTTEERGATGDVGRDRLVQKEIQLNQLAVYWNPTEDGNPCSMHLSEIPVEQAEAVISRRGALLFGVGRGCSVVVVFMPCGRFAASVPLLYAVVRPLFCVESRSAYSCFDVEGHCRRDGSCIVHTLQGVCAVVRPRL